MKNPAPPKNGQKSILSTFLESAEQMEQENRGLLFKFEKSLKLHHPTVSVSAKFRGYEMAVKAEDGIKQLS